MKRKLCIFLLLPLAMMIGNSTFAYSGQEIEDVRFDSKQEVLFTLEDPQFGNVSNIHDLAYDGENRQLYVIKRHQIGNSLSNQFTYSLETKKLCEPTYPSISGYKRLDVEFDGNQSWSLEMDLSSGFVKLNDLGLGFVQSNVIIAASGLAVKEDQVLYWNGQCVGRPDTARLGTTAPVQTEEDLSYIHLRDGGFRMAYDFSQGGEELIFAGNDFNEYQGALLPSAYVFKMNLEDTRIVERFPIVNGTQDCRVFDLYTTKDYIVVFHKNYAENKGYIERYTYDGVRVDGVETSKCVRKITEGPNGSTIYIQEKYLDEESHDKSGTYAVEVIQVNWSRTEASNHKNGPRPVIQERTRAGATVARFADHQFGLLRVEEPETGIVDYKAPIRSKENLVKLQIPYCDIKAKLESGARNLVVEYQGQTLSFPMDLFNCDDMLAAMPCQDHATIEIIMNVAETDKVTYEVQLFVVEQVNAMTRLVHRKVIK